jgi:arylsulfatase
MPRPNILLLHTDQQRFDTIAALGATHMHTPGIDRLVGRGTAFTCAYSANPVCQPARHDLITGVSARHHGYWSNANQSIQDYSLATLPRLLTDVGYQTIAVGKMHFRPDREHHGFAHMHLMEELPSCREDDAYLQYLERVGCGHVRCQHGVRPLFYHTPQESRVPEEHHGSAWVAHQTIDLLRQDRDRPLFIFASWVGPHPPYYVPRKYLDMYATGDLPAPCGPGDPDTQLRTPISPEDADSERLSHIRGGYFGATSLIDAQIARILDTLEETDQLDNTLILFTTDHGEMLGDRGHYQKHYPYEGSAHIPLIACGPGFARDLCSVPATTWDVAATILDAAGIAPPEGHPLVGRPLGSITGERERIVSFHHGTGARRYVATVGLGHKYVHWYNGGYDELYDLESDPWEQNNLSGSRTDVESFLRRAALDFERDHGPAERISDGTFADLNYQAPDSHACSLYPRWSSTQFPRWTNGYSEKDLEIIRQEMRDCLKDPHAYICTEEDWRVEAVEKWEQIGGDRKFYEELFAQVDKRQ